MASARHSRVSRWRKTRLEWDRWLFGGNLENRYHGVLRVQQLHILAAVVEVVRRTCFIFWPKVRTSKDDESMRDLSSVTCCAISRTSGRPSEWAERSSRRSQAKDCRARSVVSLFSLWALKEHSRRWAVPQCIRGFAGGIGRCRAA